MTNAQLERYQPGGVMNVSRRKTFREIDAPIREAQRHGCRIGVTLRILRCPLDNYITILLGHRHTRP